MIVRMSTLFYIGTMPLISELAAPPLGSVIMIKSSPLATMLVTTVVEFSAIFVLIFIPETLPFVAISGCYEVLPDQVYPGDPEIELEPHPSSQNNSAAKIMDKAIALPRLLKEASSFAIRDCNLILTLPAFLVVALWF